MEEYLTIGETEQAIEWNNKGSSLINLGRYAEALPYFDKALKIDPNFKDAWNDKGLCLINLERYEEAIVCYDKALKIDPDDKKAWFYKGVCLDILGRQE